MCKAFLSQHNYNILKCFNEVNALKPLTLILNIAKIIRLGPFSFSSAVGKIHSLLVRNYLLLMKNDSQVVLDKFIVTRNDFQVVPDKFLATHNEFQEVPDKFPVTRNDFRMVLDNFLMGRKKRLKRKIIVAWVDFRNWMASVAMIGID